jgi:hypothetical protein
MHTAGRSNSMPAPISRLGVFLVEWPLAYCLVLGISDMRLLISDMRLLISDMRLLISEMRLLISDTSKEKWWISDMRLILGRSAS